MDIRYAKASDGVQIAYTTLGRGSPLVVMPEPVLITMHADFSHASPKAWYDTLARDRMVVRFDHRGTGLSTLEVNGFSLDEMLLDLEATANALDLHRFALIGHEDASQFAIAFAAAHPDRVSHLILWDGFAASKLLPQAPSLMTMEQLINKNWKLWVELLVQSIFAWKGPEAISYADKLAETVPAQHALEYLTAAWEWDVTDLLSRVACPTLIINRRDQSFFPLRLGTALAGKIQGARLAILEGACSFPWVGDWKAAAALIDEHIGASPQRRRRSTPAPVRGRALATILFTDIVGSTRKASELGDRRWQVVRDSHDQIIRRELARHGGREVKSLGDGFLAVFDRPESALRCACAIASEVRELGIQIRAGVHTGEVELDGQDLLGVGVNIAARVMALAEPSETLATRTVVDLVSGSGLRFAPRGEHELKGVPGSWALLAVECAER